MAEAPTLTEKLERAKKLLETSAADESISEFQELQTLVAKASIFSDNESLEDISTKSLPFLCIEHYLAMALIQATTPKLQDRLSNLHMSCDLFDSFLSNIETVELLRAADKKGFQCLGELSSNEDESALLLPFDRDTKIARQRAKRAAESERGRLLASQQRRQRLGLRETEEVDGHDEESLLRSVHLQSIQICISEALDEWANVIRELPMLKRMVDMQRDQSAKSMHRGGDDPGREKTKSSVPRPPLQLTHITKDSASGKLQIRKEEIRSKVFQPGWNQPTMSLEELAEREVRDAKMREEQQKQAETANARAPRRYDQLVKDGLEDDKDLVDASAALDQAWDDWKDENPRGSGNKRADVGDRNF